MSVDAAKLRSGKGSGDENFPVASWIIHPRHRGLILDYYNFVRTADDIADGIQMRLGGLHLRVDLDEAALHRRLRLLQADRIAVRHATRGNDEQRRGERDREFVYPVARAVLVWPVVWQLLFFRAPVTCLLFPAAYQAQSLTIVAHRREYPCRL